MTSSEAPPPEGPPPPSAEPSALLRRPTDFWNRRPRPWATWLACALAIGIFLVLSTQGKDPLRQGFGAWVAPQAPAIWEGEYWALVTSAFVHLAWWHIAFNVYWLWILGSALERRIGSGKFFLFFCGAAVASSGMELAFADTTGIGLSGVVYAIFGFLWWRRQEVPEWATLLSPQTVRLLLVSLIFCLVMTLIKVWMVANAAHVAGLLFGVLTAGASRPDARRAPFRIAAAVLLASSLVPLFWSPWSAPWVAHEAYMRHTRGDLPAAIRGYERCLAMGFGEREWALHNLAAAYGAAGDEKHFLSTVERLRRVNPAAAREFESSAGEAGTARR
jgi:membrane associated rhomboid family serine protease